LTWKKNRIFFDDYREARDAIEHIDGEVKGYNRRFFNLQGDSLEVVPGKCAYITRTALETVERAWEEIVKGIMRPVETRVRVALLAMLLSVLHERIEKLNSLKAIPNIAGEPDGGKLGGFC